MINFPIDLAVPYVTESLPGIGGRIRIKPEHFEVHELPLYEASGEGEHLYVNITKIGLTTKQVQESVARLFGIKPSQVGFAGLKDKNAVTSQTFSVFVGRRESEFADVAAARIENELGLSVNWAKLHRNKLKTGHLLGNRFAIIVSQADCGSDDCLVRCSAVVEDVAKRGIPNYFGPQRFGIDGGNVEQGLGILKGTLKRRDKWLRKFLVSSVQSYLCNLYLAERLQNGVFDTLLPGDVAKKVETGGIFDVEDVAAEQVRFDAREISFTAPLFGPKMRTASGPSGVLETELLERAELTNEEFKRVRVSGARRMGRLLVDDMSVMQHAEGVLIRFTLPKGAYATTVLREIMKNDSELADAA